MKKNFLKKQDFLLKILSLALSIVLWAVVMDVDNPERNMRFDDVPVRIIGASQLKAATGLELIEGEDTTVTVSLRGQSKERRRGPRQPDHCNGGYLGSDRGE